MISPSGLCIFCAEISTVFSCVQKMLSHTHTHIQIEHAEYLDGLLRRLVQTAQLLLNFKFPATAAQPGGGSKF